jgi:thiol-disulfide isomerase/thioredoxin
MPYGPVFGAMFFGVVCSWLGLGLLGHPQSADRIAGLSLIALGISLALGLLRRRPWARWAGVASALAIALVALRLVALEGRVLDHVALFAAGVTALLLLIPATGRYETASPAGGARDLLQFGVTTGLLGLLVAGWLGANDGPHDPDRDPQALPASARMQRVKWLGFEAGLELAGAEGRPMLATFVTDWCPYCSKMDRETWRSASVIERLSGLIAVKIDADEREDLSARYRVSGLPSTLILDGRGEIISRSDGFLTSRQLLSWIDKAVGPDDPDEPGAAARAVLER